MSSPKLLWEHKNPQRRPTRIPHLKHSTKSCPTGPTLESCSEKLWNKRRKCWQNWLRQPCDGHKKTWIGLMRLLPIIMLCDISSATWSWLMEFVRMEENLRRWSNYMMVFWRYVCHWMLDWDLCSRVAECWVLARCCLAQRWRRNIWMGTGCVESILSLLQVCRSQDVDF